MVTLVVATHGNLSEALIHTGKMIFGNMEHVEQVTFNPGEGLENLLAKYTALSSRFDDDGALFLVDLFGGSPYNAASRFVARQPNMDVVTGVNLPMFIEVLGKRLSGGTVEDLVKTAKSSGTEGIKSFRDIFSKQKIANSAKEDEGDALG
ncbi:PTS sugar transporter subunit IIA [Sporolactobacillus sp. THM19-2]|jgi:PTS system mannose-specific IIA component/PTS system mannose-specific IIB component|uniref:PTS sugar transporter subunit IIA n=1 Tax=Sporolactobacillus sp. THM19-2 TaxID=2511171 RepID=UPI0010209ED3|nr:PTS sugar transporter subunit IIA [Sporolactobacillus sp. THM19-2]RYL91669.1 PTS sugar transporter subunit IIA [Sporolactobacillus sp. THM19-2]